MLASLRLDGFVGRNHQKDEIDSSDTGEHVAYEALMAGDVDETQTQGLATWRRQFQMGETDIDSDAASLLFFQAIGIDASEGLDQRGLSVVDVSRGTDDDGLHATNSIVAPRVRRGERDHSTAGGKQALLCCFPLVRQ